MANEELPLEYRQIFEKLKRQVEVVQQDGFGRQTPEFIETFSHHYLVGLSTLSRIRAKPQWQRYLQPTQKILIDANILLYPEEKATWKAFLNGVWTLFPASLWQNRYFHLASLLIVAISTGIGYAITLQNFEMVTLFIPDMIKSSHGTAMEAYLFSTHAQKHLLTHGRDAGVFDKSYFATFLMINNISVALRCFGFGLLMGIPTVIILIQTGLMLGALPALFVGGDEVGIWAWLLPHGVPEVGAIILSGGAGLQLGYSILHPGALSLSASLKKAVKSVGGMVILCAILLIWAGLVESFVRQSYLSNTHRFMIAGASLVPFILLFLRAYWAHKTLYASLVELSIPESALSV